MIFVSCTLYTIVEEEIRYLQIRQVLAVSTVQIRQVLAVSTVQIRQALAIFTD